jgi:hypothetical protein
MQLSSQQAQ